MTNRDCDARAVERARQRLRRATHRLRWPRVFTPKQIVLLEYVQALAHGDLCDAGLQPEADAIVRAGRR